MERTARIFDSFEDADAADLAERARMTPEQRVEFSFYCVNDSIPMPLHKDLREFIE